MGAIGIPDDIGRYLYRIKWAICGDQEGSLVDFFRATFEILDFLERGTGMIARFTMRLSVCRTSYSVQADMCLRQGDSRMILLTLQGDRHGSKMTQPETQVIPVAIAMFQYNNKKRVNTGLAPLDAMTVPCIAMVALDPLSIWFQLLKHSEMRLCLASTPKLQPQS
ncbi:uncharacterized protein EI90DRAFT_3225566 [Cantharellus anzutake]|uniref:uncharacterized protein n=1 Tax=Cantharellus anzutake TaxID=1750568 RepID=UPI001907A215|nr:uncharacterized protein EI90DRAFT_3225566 [Cantharellus anzutake]KAF8327189.1 hypothetical protein EI90DRAFT_3225566 [Cantharellus anzutake]